VKEFQVRLVDVSHGRRHPAGDQGAAPALGGRPQGVSRKAVDVDGDRPRRETESRKAEGAVQVLRIPSEIEDGRVEPRGLGHRPRSAAHRHVKAKVGNLFCGRLKPAVPVLVRPGDVPVSATKESGPLRLDGQVYKPHRISCSRPV